MNTRDPIFVEPPRRDTSDFVSGQKLAACYVLGHRLEKQNGAAVWLAYDEVRGRELSLYFIPNSVRVDEAKMQGIRKMVDRLCLLTHPNILQVYGLVEEAHWSAIAMDHFDGETLEAFQHRKLDGCFEPLEIQSWLIQICGALEQAHKSHVIHGDLSPANIYIQKDDRVLLANFEVSRCFRDHSAVACQELTASDDIHAFGLLLQTLLVGTFPPSLHENVREVTNEAPFSIAQQRAVLRKVAAVTIPVSWEKITAACLEKDPQFRPASIAEIATQLTSEKSTIPPLALTRGFIKKFSSEIEAPAFARPKMPPIGMLLPNSKSATISQIPVFKEDSSIPHPSSCNPSMPGLSISLPMIDEQEVSTSDVPNVGNLAPTDQHLHERSRKTKALFQLAAALVLSGAGIYAYCVYQKEKAESRRALIKTGSRTVASTVSVPAIAQKRTLPASPISELDETLGLPPMSEETEPGSIAQAIDPVKTVKADVKPVEEDTTSEVETKLVKQQVGKGMMISEIQSGSAEKIEPLKITNNVLAQKELENSLGMKFVPVGKVLFCIWPTRIADFEAFAKATKFRSMLWKTAPFNKAPDYPVVNVSWLDAMSFCKWLTDREHQEGRLPANQSYRLPRDLEWSEAVGLGEENGETPAARDMGLPDVYPWGNDWPPLLGTGNYAGEETHLANAIKGYKDSFIQTSPVGSFPRNSKGLYDMGGNVWQWCMEAWSFRDPKIKVLRGASWSDGHLKPVLLSTCRIHSQQDDRASNYGFRCVIETAD